MSSEPAVRFESVTKRYRRRSGRAAVRDVLRRPGVDDFGALDDVSFEVPEGSAFGLVGDNGAGKTTALRLMTRITRPTSGRVSVAGVVGALIEVGSGIHPDLTGRENIWLYGQFLGLSRRDIATRFDAIVDFSELSDALDQQVKYYSSGMQLRLGFSIAAHVDPEVLIVDEALAVGDIRFQRRCVARMQEFVNAGTTVIYVSHDLRTVEALCDRILWLDHGRVVTLGPTRDVLADYIASRSVEADVALHAGGSDDGVLTLLEVEVGDGAGGAGMPVAQGDGAVVTLRFRGPELTEPNVAVGLTSGGPHPFAVFSMTEHGTAPEKVSGEWEVRLEIDALPLRRGRHEVWCGVTGADGLTDLLSWRRVGALDVEAPIGSGRRGVTEVGALVLPHRFKVS